MTNFSLVSFGIDNKKHMKIERAIMAKNTVQMYASDKQYTDIVVNIGTCFKQIKTWQLIYAKTRSYCNHASIIQFLKERFYEILEEVTPFHFEYQSTIKYDDYIILVSILNKLQVLRSKFNHFVHICFRNCDVIPSLYPRLTLDLIQENVSTIPRNPTKKNKLYPELPLQ